MKLPTWATTVTPLSKTIAFILFVTLPIVSFYWGVSVGQKGYLPDQLTEHQNSPLPTKQLSQFASLEIEDMTIQVPRNWWYQHGKNDYFPTFWYEINPTRIHRETSLPDFLFRADDEVLSLEEKVDEQVKTWRLVQVEYKNLTVDGINGTQIIGIADPNDPHHNSRFRPNDKVAITIFKKGNYTYQLLGLLNTHEQEYFQAVQTIRFE